MASNRKYDKICLFCRKEFQAQKRNTIYCGHKCAQKAYKVNHRLEVQIEVSFEEFVKKQLLEQNETLNEINKQLEHLSHATKVVNAEYLAPNDYCELKGIGRKTLSRWIKENKVEVKKLSTRKFLIKS